MTKRLTLKQAEELGRLSRSINEASTPIPIEVLFPAADGPEAFTWHAGIPARDRFCYATVGETPVRVTWLTLLDLLLIEAVDGQRMPTSTISTIDLSGTFPERILLDLGVRP